MNKPHVFLSHSSRDAEVLRRLKDALVQKTQDEIEFFLSSDGQSIPLGRNWVFKVQEALETTEVMFVFLSPQSVHTHWVYFEAGYVYKKGIRVIPVGILGVDLSNLPAPISLLQGFNVRSADSLNNLIAVLNGTFAQHHQPSFTTEEYEWILGESIDAEVSRWITLASYIDTIHFSIKCEFSEVISAAQKVLTKHDVCFQATDGSLRFAGAFLAEAPYRRTTRASVELEPTMFPANLQILQEVRKEIEDRVDPQSMIDVYFCSNIYLVSEDSKLTARLHGSPIEFGDEKRLRYKQLEFEIEHHPYAQQTHSQVFVRLHNHLNEISEDDLADLIEILFQRNILLVGE